MSDSHFALRPEAGPVPFDQLNRSQRDAMKAIVGALREAAEQAGKLDQSSRCNDDAGWVDEDRASRLFFVSGQPGSGKSSLYLTLRAILGKEQRHETLRPKYESKVPHLRSLEGQTRWLETIDLEVAGEEGENLLAAVLVRIFDTIDDSAGMPSTECRKAMEQLEELANDIGIAWDGNLKARAGSLDPDTYSQEVIRAQRTRLGINRRLRRAIDTLLKKNCYAFNTEQLFVLPIDDFYLKPAASLELLRLLRMISVPRLFFLIMGDIKTMEALFFEKALADWTRVAGPQVFASLDDPKKQEVLSRVREMKARYLRKLLPVGQRATILWMFWHEALRYKPVVAERSSSNPDELWSLLSKVCICWKVDTEVAAISPNLLNFMVAPRYDPRPAKAGDTGSAESDGPVSKSEKETEDSAKRLKPFREAYSALLVLAACRTNTKSKI